MLRKGKKNTRTATTSRLSIPNDIIIEILSWVPANSLLRLRWAYKYWFDLISRNPDFVKMQLHHSTTSPNSHDSSVLISELCQTIPKKIDLQCYYSVLISTLSLTRAKKIDLQCYLNYTTSCSFSHPKRIASQVPFEFFDRKTDVITSINGLLFWYKHDQRRYCIWNPCTNEYRMLPDPPIDDESSFFYYGFGYDHIIDDYKVVIIESKGYYLDSNVYIYTLGTNSWRCIRPISPNLQPLRTNKDLVFVNGALCWLNSSKTKIISFDIGKEKYKQVLIKPPKGSHGIWRCLKLHAFENSICLEVLFTTDPTAEKFKYYLEMWMLSSKYDLNNNEEYPWTKLQYLHRQIETIDINQER